MAKTIAKTASQKSEKTSSREELLASVAGFEFHVVEIVGGRNFPIGEKFDCIKVGVSSYGKPYTVISVDGADRFCDPKNLKVLKPMAEIKAVAAKAALDEAREATLLVAGTIKNESEKAVLLSHSGWFKAKWFPKSLITKIGDHEDGEQAIYEVPRWKIAADHGPDGLKALQGLQEMYEEMVEEPAKPEPKPELLRKTATGKYTGKTKK